MTYQSKTADRSASIPSGLGIGLLLSWVMTVGMGMVIAFLITGERIETTALAPMSVGTMLLAVFAGAMLSAKKIGSQRMVICLCSGGLYYVSLLGCNALFFDGSYRGILPAFLMVIGASLVAGLMGLRQKGTKFKSGKSVYRG